MERPHFSDHLEAIKFICKDFWSELFKKQIDNLKTNHRIIDFVGLHVCQLIHLLQKEIYLKIILRVKTR
ncbi:hypothetical protein ACJW30_03G052300 [Castanea mollissima]